MAEWELYYWHSLPGRGDFVRLLFEEAGVPYLDVARKEGSSSKVLEYRQRGKTSNLPSLFPPIIKKGDFVLCQTSAILQYLGKEFGLYPTGGAQQEAIALQMVLIAADYIAEGHDCFHPVRKSGTYDSQKEEAAHQIKIFREERMPGYNSYVHHILLHACNHHALESKGQRVATYTHTH